MGLRVGIITPKEKVALGSVIAAIILVLTKFIVGIWTNSLGILSEALHSSIDLLAAVMTLFAVRMADRPPDLDHHYGHAKIESMSSLAETMLLFLTCFWITYEALHRLFFVDAIVDINYIAILVVVMSIVVDYTRSRALMRAAKKYKSQALEADAIHFSTDLLSSGVVLIGLFITMAGFKSFDSIAALGVAVITAYIGWGILKRSMNTLLDAAPQDIPNGITETIASVPGVMGVGRVRVRDSGHKVFMDVMVFIDKALPLEKANRVTADVTKKIEDMVPNVDVVIHAEPLCPNTDDLVQMIREEAVGFPAIHTVHNIRVSKVDEELHVDMHLEMDGSLNIKEAHEVASMLEERIKEMNRCVSYVSSHLEPADNGFSTTVSQEDMLYLRRSIEETAKADPNILSLHEIIIRKTHGQVGLSLCCTLDHRLNVKQAHEVATNLENRLMAMHEEINYVNVHVEPDIEL
ncbi:MAG: ferrous iron efflux protein F [Methanomassiliicoccales archaeon PtaU1.Bin124]|nr:MAG: ferrous iron efflux protein F [Methanomassiliicoccales archaeon PtaU1.Bin124]